MSANATSQTILDRTLGHATLVSPSRALVVALAVVLTAVSAQFTMPLPFTAVPFVLTPMVVLLTGAALGSRLGMLSQVIYVALGAAGLAVFAPSPTLPPGLLRLVGPTGGYLMAYPIAAFVTGALAERGWDRRYLSSVGAMLAGLAIIFIGGVAWLSVSTTHSLSAAVAGGFVPFVALDVVKVVAAAAILPQAWRVAGARR
jgi:biotin transport system substrate-specific component